MHGFGCIFSVILMFSMLSYDSKAQSTDNRAAQSGVINDTASVSIDSLKKKIAAFETEILGLKTALEKQIKLYEIVKKHDEQREIEMIGLRKESLRKRKLDRRACGLV